MKGTYGLGIDLGTTQTAAAVRDDAGRVEVVRLGGRRAEIPSLVFVKDDGGLLLGEAAERRGLAEPGRLAREFKRRIGDPVPILVGGTPFSAHALTAKLLRHVLDEVTRLRDGAPASLTLTHPANWGPYKREQFSQAVRLADAGAVKLITEPEAAALQHATARRIALRETVLVYDLGGGTFDVALLRRDADGFSLVGEPEGVEQLGGADFDEAVFAHVVGALGSAAQGLDPDDDAVTEALARLRRDCVEAKEALSFDTETSIPVALPGLHTRVRLNRSELESMISPALEDTIAATRRALRGAGVDAGQVSAVLLAGGSSRIPLVAQMLSEEFGRPVVADPHPEHSIALGAAVATGAPLAAPEHPEAQDPWADHAESPAAAPTSATGAMPRTAQQNVEPGWQPDNQPVSRSFEAGSVAPHVQGSAEAVAAAGVHPTPTQAMPTQAVEGEQRSPVAFSRGAASVPGSTPTPPLAPTATFPTTPDVGTPPPAEHTYPHGPAGTPPPAQGPRAYEPVSTPPPAGRPRAYEPVSTPPAAERPREPVGTPPPAERPRPYGPGVGGPYDPGVGTPPPADRLRPYEISKPADPEPPHPRRRNRRLAIAGAAGAVLIAATAGTLVALNWGNGDGAEKAQGSTPPSLPASSSAPAGTPIPGLATDARLLVRVDTGPVSQTDRVSTVSFFKPGLGTAREQLAGTVDGDTLPRWSHDRKQVVLTHLNPGSTSDIMIMDADGSNRRKLASGATNGRASWSGDDQQIVFVKKVGPVNQFFTVPAAGGKPKQLTTSDDPKDDPVWTSNNDAIVYWQERDGARLLYAMHVTRKVERRITDASMGPAVDPALDPNDHWIVYTKQIGKNDSDIYIIAKDSSTPPRRLTDSPEREMDPTFSPDGKWIAFVRGTYEEPTVVVMKTDGTSQTVLTKPGEREGHPCWF
ncbi:Hsp70 family protein [Paractinoplanes hotanensis]|uniref:Hsp70 family protein n=1 Tax=Paractinoplanes hotanensis TaxID=2906497 RepID=A0ABT0YG59_9ACTN|nr:Hsp70 family protein [Actinoplanes hotanensis]MCM4085019.1 Hsp70 family protein [Actinoplanes hotanensis]